jgi:hypothetical protein
MLEVLGEDVYMHSYVTTGGFNEHGVSIGDGAEFSGSSLGEAIALALLDAWGPE